MMLFTQCIKNMKLNSYENKRTWAEVFGVSQFTLDCRQKSFLLKSVFEWIYEILLPLNSSENEDLGGKEVN